MFRFVAGIVGTTLLLHSHADLRGSIIINEALTSSIIKTDELDLEGFDWIELLNIGPSRIDLTGWGLSDDPDRPLRWRFPQIQMEPGTYLRLWASALSEEPPPEGSETSIPPGLHLPFRLSSAGETLTLTDVLGRTVDTVSIPSLPPDVSFGRGFDASNRQHWFHFSEPTPEQPNTTAGFEGITSPPLVSTPGGIHTNALQVAFSHPDPEVTIYYTLDGSIPHPDNLEGTTFPFKQRYPERPGNPFGALFEAVFQTFQYTHPIPVRDRTPEPNYLSHRTSTWEFYRGSFFWSLYPIGPVFKGQPIRACAVKPGHLPSAVISHTYYVTPNPTATFTLPIVSITLPEADLFDYENGIYCAGIDYDQWRAENPQADPVYRWRLPANYTREGRAWEIPAHFEVFDATKGPQLSQAGGLRIHGADTRAFPQKNLRLYARTAYSGTDDFDIPLHPEATGSLKNKTIDHAEKFNRVILQAGYKHQDVISMSVLSPLEVGLQRSRPMAQFINGEFWGITYARDRHDAFHFANRYDIDPSNLVIVYGPFGYGRSYMIEEGVPEDIALYQEFSEWVTGQSIRDNAKFEEVNRMIDIDSYIDYNIAFLYMNNTSWYGVIHFKFWRARETGASPFADGRFRVVIWDFDHFNQNPAYDYIQHAIDPNGTFFNNNPQRTLILRRLLANTQFKNRLVNRFASHMNTTFRPERFDAIANEELAKLGDFAAWHFNRWAEPIDRRTLWKTFSRERPRHIRNQLRHHFDLGENVTFQVDSSDVNQGSVAIEGFDPSDERFTHLNQPFPWSVTYFAGTPIDVEARPRQGHRFVRWQGMPEGTPARFTRDPALLPSQLIAIFEPRPRWTLAHYWDFNDLDHPLNPTIHRGLADLAIDPTNESEVTTGNAQGFRSINARLESEAGTHLRINNPTGAHLTFTLPTIGLRHIVLSYETRRSENAPAIQRIEYTLDGLSYHELQTVYVAHTDPELVRLDFSQQPGSSDNPDFALRISFIPEESKTGGNHRFDNLTLEGEVIQGTHFISPLASIPKSLHLTHNDPPLEFDLSTWFSTDHGSSASIDGWIDDPTVVRMDLENRVLHLSGLRPGNTWLTLQATPRDNPQLRIRTSHLVFVHPTPHRLADAPFSFNHWNPNEPDHAYPPHMMFVQSRQADPDLQASLPHAYHIPSEEYHSDDRGTVGYPYNNSRRTRINGLGEDGVLFLNTGRPTDLGGAMLALDTRACTDVRVRWTSQILTTGERTQGLRLQYRTNVKDAFQDFYFHNQPVDFTGRVTGAPVFHEVTLPAALLGHSHLVLLWRYYAVEGDSGARAGIRLDDIHVDAHQFTLSPPPTGIPPTPGPMPLHLHGEFIGSGPALLRHNDKVIATFESVPKWVLVDLIEGSNQFELEWTDPSNADAMRVIQTEIVALPAAHEDIWFENPLPDFSTINLKNEVHAPLSEVLKDSAWKGYYSMVSGVSYGAADPFGSFDALYIPGADRPGLNDSAASGLILWQQDPLTGGSYLVRAWLRSEDLNLPIQMGMLDRANASSRFLLSQEWQRYSLIAQFPYEIGFLQNRVFQVVERTSGNKGWWIHAPEVYKLPEIQLTATTSLPAGTQPVISLIRNGRMTAQTPSTRLDWITSAESAAFEYWMATVRTSDGRLLVSKPMILQTAPSEPPGVSIVSTSELRVTALDGAHLILEQSLNLTDWKLIHGWQQSSQESILNIQHNQDEPSVYFRVRQRPVGY